MQTQCEDYHTRQKLLNADKLRHRALFLNHEGTFDNQDRRHDYFEISETNHV